MDRYAVIGNPVAHSLSPEIHAAFAAQLGEAIEYATLLAPRDAFALYATRFFEGGARGANVTLPFKEAAFALAASASERARLAGAANFLARRDDGTLHADNTDGVGLVRDLVERIGCALAGRRLLLLGAGGAARGVLGPLLACGPEAIVVANRTPQRAQSLAQAFAALGPVSAAALDAIPVARYHVVVNATSSSVRGEPLALAPGVLAPGTLAYDMAYAAAARPFLAMARAAGAEAHDGLGMLVEQAAESWFQWRGRRPATAPVLAQLRSRLG